MRDYHSNQVQSRDRSDPLVDTTGSLQSGINRPGSWTECVTGGEYRPVSGAQMIILDCDGPSVVSWVWAGPRLCTPQAGSDLL